MLVGAKFCPNCGYSIQGTTARTQILPQPQALPSRRRPPLTTALMLFAYLFGLALLVLGALSMGVSGTSATVLLEELVILSVVGFLSLVSGYGLMKGRKWLRKEGLVAGVASVLMGLLFVPTVPVVGVPGLIFGVGLLLYLRRPSSRDYLET